MNEDAEPAFRFYWNRPGRGVDTAGVEWAGRLREEPAQRAQGVARMASRYPRFWGLFTHMPPKEMETLRQLILQRCDIEASVVEGDARLERYRCREP